jgi:uncharacterized Rmd1/YagE family protein
MGGYHVPPPPLFTTRRRRRANYRRMSPLPSSGGSGGGVASPSSMTEQHNIMPLLAFHIAQTIDVHKVMQQVFVEQPSDTQSNNNNNSSTTTDTTSTTLVTKKKFFGKNTVVLELSNQQYVAVYGFGSLVCLNVPPQQAHAWCQAIKRMASTEPVLSGNERSEQFGVLVVPPPPPFVRPSSLYGPMLEDEVAATSLLDEVVVTGDYCVVPELDINAVAVMSNIMAQTVALDTYNDTVDHLLARFAALNTAVAKTGQFRAEDKDFLFKTVATNNSIFIDMISKIRIKDRSDTVWNMTKYEKIHYGLKEEFEIDGRFDHIEFKLDLIQQNAKFFLELVQSQKSNSLEWIIVVLILLECGLMCLEMAGLGEPLFHFIGSMVPRSSP